jgi:hypothetical protein
MMFRRRSGGFTYKSTFKKSGAKLVTNQLYQLLRKVEQNIKTNNKK